MNIRALASAILALSVASGCTDFSPIEDGVCGNHILEPGEDCDGFSQFVDGDGESVGECGAVEDSNACFYVCDESSSCPPGWGCGQDSRCRRPSGEFTPAAESLRFDVNQLGVGDLDGDGNADLIGIDDRAISVRYGAGDGTFPAELEFVTRRPTGPATFGAFNNDGLTDIVVPTDSGLFVALGESDRGLDPVAYAPFSFADAELRIHAVQSDGIFQLLPVPSLLLLVGDPNGGQDAMAFIDGGSIPLAPNTVGSIRGRVPIADITGLGDNEEWAIAASGRRQVDIYTTVVADVPQLHKSVNIPTGSVHQGAMFAQVDGSGGLDLLVSFKEDGTGLSRVGVALHGAVTVADDVTKIPVFDREGLNDIPFPLAVGDFNSDGRDDYVVHEFVAMAGGAAGQAPNALLPTAFALTGQWSDAAVGDFNDDDKLDFAAALDGQDQLEVFLGDGQGLFNRFVVSTPVPAGQLRVGDYDGDFVDDLAFIALAETEDEQDELYVAFGQLSGGLSEPIDMGRLNRVDALEPMPGLGLFDADLATDLIVVSKSLDGANTAVAIMQSSSSRRMISPFTLQANNKDYIPHQAVFGKILEDDEFTDILAVAEPVPEDAGDVTPMGPDGSADPDLAVPPEVFVFRIPGKDELGGLDASKLEADELGANQFALRCARWAVGDLDNSGIDDLVGIDRAQECPPSANTPAPQTVVLPNNNLSQMVSTPLDSIGFEAPDIAVLRDMDGDGGLDYMVLFRGDFRDGSVSGNTGSIEGSGVSVFWNDGGELDLERNFSAVHVEDGSRLFGVAAVNLNDDSFEDVMILTSSGLWPAIYQPDDQSFLIGDPIVVPAQATLLASGDFNGDGLDDVAYVYGTDLDVHLAVPAAPVGGVR